MMFRDIKIRPNNLRQKVDTQSVSLLQNSSSLSVARSFQYINRGVSVW